MAHSAHKDPEQIKEHIEEESSIDEKAKLFANWILESKHFIAFTGAGVSTSTGIPDFRGPEGAWTLANQNKPRTSPTVSTLKAVPSTAHMSIKSLIEKGYLKHLISQNCDGLHRRSGIPPTKISELHGNSNLEMCKTCGKKYLRDFDASAHYLTSVHDHRTGRKCSKFGCNGDLYDSIINFGENLPAEALEGGFKNAEQSDLCLVLGSSLTVTPAANMPKLVGEKKGGKLVIVNLQKTPLDNLASMRVYAKTDDFMQRVLHYLELPIQQWELRRKLVIGNQTDEKNGKLTVYLQGIDSDDGTPLSFIKSATINSRELSKEPFILPIKEPSKTIDILLEFMGHYNEPCVQIAYAPINPSGSQVYSLVFNPYQKVWNVAALPEKVEIDLKDLQTIANNATMESTQNSEPMETSESPFSMQGMFAVEPKRDCPHLSEHFHSDKAPTVNTLNISAPCVSCGSALENWICLTCFGVRCSRYMPGKHQAKHFDESGHAIGVSFSDGSVWCYICDSYITHPTLREFLKTLGEVKFGKEVPIY